MELYKALEEYRCSDAYPFHMPGHKRNLDQDSEFWPPLLKEWYASDITEIDGFDDLHHADGILKEAMDRAARLFHAEKSYFLLNGSTCGILAAVSAAAPKGAEVLMMRGCHKSVYHAALLRELRPVYLDSHRLMPMELDLGITAEEVKEALGRHPEIRAVILTSPTYEGISLPLKEIAEYLHEKQIPLIVDAAHGAHFGMADFLPENAVSSGADLVVQSLHKTLPAPTQAAILHWQGKLVNPEELETYLGIFETSSPSYPMMAAIDLCIRYCSEDRRAQWQQFYQRRQELTQQIRNLRHIGILDYFHQEKELALPQPCIPEIGKMLLYVKDWNAENGWNDGKWLYDRLRKGFGLQPELSMPGYVLLFLTFFDTQEGYDRLAHALAEIDGELQELVQNSGKRNVHAEIDGKLQEPVQNSGKRHALAPMEKEPQLDKVSASDMEKFFEPMQENTAEIKTFRHPHAVMTIAQAMERQKTRCDYQEALGRISGAFLMVYPPGQPLLVPGETVDEHVIRQIRYYRSHSYELRGMQGDLLEIISEEMQLRKENALRNKML